MADKTNQHNDKNYLIVHYYIPRRLQIKLIENLLVPLRNTFHIVPSKKYSSKGDKQKRDSDFPKIDNPSILIFIRAYFPPIFINQHSQSVQPSPNHKLPRCSVP